MMELNSEQLRALAAVVDQGGFEAAAAFLHVTPSAVSQRIKALENQVGAVLVRRARPVSVTDPGAVLLRLARQVAALETEARLRLGLQEPSGRYTVQLVINADSLATWVLPALAPLQDVDFEFTVEDQDYSADSLRNGTAMGAVTSSSAAVQGCTVKPLGTMKYRPVASPAFVRRWLPEGWNAASAATVPMVVFNQRDALQQRFLQDCFGPGLAPPHHFIPASWDFLQATRLGFGWAVLPEIQAAPLLADGSLVLLDPERSVDVPLFWQQWRVQLPALSRVADALAAEAARALA